jgi:hypothetical protein
MKSCKKIALKIVSLNMILKNLFKICCHIPLSAEIGQQRRFYMQMYLRSFLLSSLNINRRDKCFDQELTAATKQHLMANMHFLCNYFGYRCIKTKATEQNVTARLSLDTTQPIRIAFIRKSRADETQRNACCYSVPNRFTSRLLTKKVKIKTHDSIILFAVLYECEIWNRTLN